MKNNHTFLFNFKEPLIANLDERSRTALTAKLIGNQLRFYQLENNKYMFFVPYIKQQIDNNKGNFSAI